MVDINEVYIKDKKLIDLLNNRIRDDKGNLQILDLSHEKLDNIDFKGMDLISVDFDSADLENCNMNSCKITDVNFDNTCLCFSRFEGAELKRVSFVRSNLKNVDFTGAQITDVDFTEAILKYTYFQICKITDVSFSDCNAPHIVFRDAILEDICFDSANLYGADFRASKLVNIGFDSANLCIARFNNSEQNDISYGPHTCFYAMQCPEEGSFIGYKKSRNKIVKLLILEDSLRSSATSRKCRASKVKVLSITSIDNTMEYNQCENDWPHYFKYKVGETYVIEDFNKDRWNECCAGIHFFITRKEAEMYN